MPNRRYQVFRAVAKFESFTRAAEYLHMTQPAVTFQIKQLEDHLNVRLFERGHGRVTLTSAGDLALGYAEKMLVLVEELDARMSELTDELSGQLHIGSIPTIAGYWLPPMLVEFKRRHPHVQPRVVMGNAKQIEDGIAARELDIGFIELASGQSVIEHRAVAREELVVICSPDYLLARHARLSARDLVGHPFIDRDPGSGMRQAADEFFKAAGIDANLLPHCAELGSLTAVKEFAASGLGFAISSRRASLLDVEQGRLVAIPLDPPAYATIQMILPRDKFRSRLIVAFSEFISAQIALLGLSKGLFPVASG